MLGVMAKPSLNYPRYKPNPVRPPGAGAFFDFAAGVASRNAPKLKSCSLPRRWGNPARAADTRPSGRGSLPYVSFLLAGLPHEV
jgi:hypothetical protein